MHEYFPGGNTPLGFYSYYHYISAPEDTKKSIILKGGPGTGKSTIMKKVAEQLNKAGYETARLHCSSDPDSLDAIVSDELGFCMLDGTAPHTIDPRYPGAIDTILHLGDYWDAASIQMHKTDILHTSKEISESFASAYDYLKAAAAVQNHIQKNIRKHTDTLKLTKALNTLTSDLKLTGNTCGKGKIKKAFLSAFTPKGTVSHIDSFASSASHIIALDAEYDISEFFTNPLSRTIEQTGKDAFFFYCPMQPDTKIEHIYLPSENLLITTENEFHKCTFSAEHIDLNQHIEMPSSLHADRDIFNILISRAISCIRSAKTLHDALEQYYIPYMNFDALEKLPKKILAEIL